MYSENFSECSLSLWTWFRQKKNLRHTKMQMDMVLKMGFLWSKLWRDLVFDNIYNRLHCGRCNWSNDVISAGVPYILLESFTLSEQEYERYTRSKRDQLLAQHIIEHTEYFTCLQKIYSIR